MSDKKEKKISENAKKAEDISQDFTEEVKMAAESMRRAIKKRKMNAIALPQCKYRQIY